MTHLDGVELDAGDTVDAPRKRAHWLGALLVPDLDDLATCRELVILPVVVDAVEDRLEAEDSQIITIL